MTQPILFVGAGNMGGAIIRGYLATGGVASDITIVDPFAAKSAPQALQGIKIVPDFDALSSDESFGSVVLAIKPQIFHEISGEVGQVSVNSATVISIMAGITSKSIQAAIGEHVSVVRCMPNMAAAAGYSVNVAYTTDDTKRAGFEQLFQGTGPVKWVEAEEQIHVTTAVSGSGPAYFFAFVEALAEAGRNYGLDAQLAGDLAIDTLIGAGELLKSNRDPEGLRKSVTSKGGTTAAALDELGRHGNLSAVVDDAVSAAMNRSKELATQA